MNENTALKSMAAATTCSDCPRELARDVAYCPYCGKNSPNVVQLRLNQRVDGNSAVGGIKPFAFGGKDYFSLAEVMAALPADWAAAVKANERGYLLDWVRSELHDYATAGYLEDLRENTAIRPDERLFCLLVRFAPNRAPCWKGQWLDRDRLLAICEPQSPMSGLVREVLDLKLLSRFGEITGKKDYAAMERDWLAVVSAFHGAWRALESSGGPGDAFPGDAWLAPCAYRALHSPAFAHQLAEQAQKCREHGAAACDWYAAVPDSIAGQLIISLVANQAIDAGRTALSDKAYSAVIQVNVKQWKSRRSVLVCLSLTNGLLLGAVMGWIRYEWNDAFSRVPAVWDVWGNTTEDSFSLPMEYFLASLVLLAIAGAFAGCLYAYYSLASRKLLEHR